MILVLLSALLACGPGPETVAEQLASDNPAVREDTARRARNFDDPVVIEGLVKSLEDPSDNVRLNAIDSIIELDAQEAVPKLVELMTSDPSDLVRRDAIDALGRLGDPRAVPGLVALLESDPTHPPLNAIWALGEMGDMTALPILTQLRDSRDPYVAYNANQALRRLRPSGG